MAGGIAQKYVDGVGLLRADLSFQNISVFIHVSCSLKENGHSLSITR